MPKIAVWLLVAGVLIGAGAALWLSGEMHYRNCLQTYVVEREGDSYPASYMQSEPVPPRLLEAALLIAQGSGFGRSR